MQFAKKGNNYNNEPRSWMRHTKNITFVQVTQIQFQSTCSWPFPHFYPSVRISTDVASNFDERLVRRNTIIIKKYQTTTSTKTQKHKLINTTATKLFAKCKADTAHTPTLLEHYDYDQLFLIVKVFIRL